MWTHEHRQNHTRKTGRYQSDLLDGEWELLGSLLPPAKRGGRPRTVDMREVVNTLLYVLWTGCQWHAIPKDLLPKSTAYDYFSLWRSDRTLEKLQEVLYERVRVAEGRAATPTVGIIDSQSAKAAQKGGPGSIRKATTRARKWSGASVTSPSTRSACC